jgi:hypothetical protein
MPSAGALSHGPCPGLHEQPAISGFSRYRLQLAFIGVDIGTFPTKSAVLTPLWHGPCPAAVLPP